jgi:hypothetical protein
VGTANVFIERVGVKSTYMRIASNANGNARRNKKEVEKERQILEEILSGCPDSRVEVTKEEEEVPDLCNRYIDDGIEIALLSGGDGTVQEFMTEFFKASYLRFGEDMLPIEFANSFNSMALDPESGLILPDIYHKRRGEVNYYSDTLRMRCKKEQLRENISEAEQGEGRLGFRRAYALVLMLYNKDDPKDLKHVRLLTSFADCFLFNIFNHYYIPKDAGGDSTALTAMSVIGRTATSVVMDRLLPRDSLRGKLYQERYQDQILRQVQGEVKVDGKTVVEMDQKRTLAAMGSMCMSLYGLKPFYRMPGSPDEFLCFPQGVPEDASKINLDEHYFQIFTGSPDALDIVKKFARTYLRIPPNVPGAVDMLASMVEITQSEILKYIADGSREKNGSSCMVAKAMLWPFILLNEKPMSMPGSARDVRPPTYRHNQRH